MTGRVVPAHRHDEVSQPKAAYTLDRQRSAESTDRHDSVGSALTDRPRRVDWRVVLIQEERQANHPFLILVL